MCHPIPNLPSSSSAMRVCWIRMTPEGDLAPHLYMGDGYPRKGALSSSTRQRGRVPRRRRVGPPPSHRYLYPILSLPFALRPGKLWYLSETALEGLQTQGPRVDGNPWFGIIRERFLAFLLRCLSASPVSLTLSPFSLCACGIGCLVH